MSSLSPRSVEERIHPAREESFEWVTSLLYLLPCTSVNALSMFANINLSQLIPGHEAIGTVVEMGSNVKGFDKGDRCVADVGITVRGKLYARIYIAEL